MQIFDLIAARRTIKDFEPQPVPDELLERLLEAGLWAQNHRLTQPWRFTLLGPQTKLRLEASFPKVREKPTIVAVSCLRSADAVQEREDYAAVACAIQNIALVAWECGIGLQWSSGAMATSEAVSDLIELDINAEFVVGLLFLGYAREVPPPRARKPLSEVLRRTA